MRTCGVEVSGMAIKLDFYVMLGIRGSEQPLLDVTTVPGQMALLSVKVITFFHLLYAVILLPLNVSKPWHCVHSLIGRYMR